jgi:cytochrome c oxidase assembly factor CtaG
LRNVWTAFAAFVASVLAGGLAAQAIAVAMLGQEEFILVFMGIAPLGLLLVLPLLAASYRAQPQGAVTRVAVWLAGVLALLLAALAGFSVYMSTSGQAVGNDLPILTGIAVPAALMLAVQWLVFRLRTRPAAPPPLRFGRAGGPA